MDTDVAVLVRCHSSRGATIPSNTCTWDLITVYCMTNSDTEGGVSKWAFRSDPQAMRVIPTGCGLQYCNSQLQLVGYMQYSIYRVFYACPYQPSRELLGASQLAFCLSFLTTLWSLHFVLPSPLHFLTPLSISGFIVPKFPTHSLDHPVTRPQDHAPQCAGTCVHGLRETIQTNPRVEASPEGKTRAVAQMPVLQVRVGSPG